MQAALASRGSAFMARPTAVRAQPYRLPVAVSLGSSFLQLGYEMCA